MEQNWDWNEALDHYRRQGAPGDQNALVSLLREVQQAHGGVLPAHCLSRVAEAYGLKESFLTALVKRYPSLRPAAVPHTLELCGGPNCAKRQAAELAAFLEREYGAKPGGDSQRGGFSLRLTGCMKRCGQGPNIKWDGEHYPAATPELLRRLIGQG